MTGVINFLRLPGMLSASGNGNLLQARISEELKAVKAL